MNLVPLYEEAIQFNDYNGTVLAAGKVEVWYLGRTRLADIYSDVAGEIPLQNPFNLNDLGMQEVYVNPAFNYTLVVYDAYNSELFSVDKYLQGAGDHNTSNVVVQPSEHIGVSAWTVGDVQIYQPYIVGELGKTYHGIEPIVVNNQENKISARNIALGVQEPLYFVEDSESACIIGASGLQPSGNYATVDWVNEHDYMQKEKLEFNESGQVTGFDGSAFAAGYVDPSDFIPWSASSTFQSAGNYATTDDLTAYQEKGDYYSASNPSGFINSDAISAMATTGFVADVSADITAMIPTALTGDYLTKESADTLYQPLGDYATTADLTGKQDTLTFGYTDDQISTINGSGIYGQGGGVTGEYELSAGNGISINNDPINQKTVISVSGDYATNSDLQTVSGEITAMIPTALTGDYLTKDSADTLYQPIGSYLSSNALEGYATENWVTSQGYITTETDWTNTITAASANAYNEATAAIPTGLATTGDLASVSADITAQIPTDLFTKASADTLYQPLGDYLTTGDSANFATTGDVEDLVSAISETYQPITAMTAYQPVGDYLTTGDSAEFMTTAERSDYIPTGVSSEFYTTANTANYISEVPAGTMNESAFDYSGGMITAYNGSAFKAGDELPEGLMNESAVEYNAVNEISGYNGSAIAQYGAEKQWLTHDDTIVHVANSAQYAFGVNLSGISADLARMMGVDETVLADNISVSATGFTLSEKASNFETIKIYGTYGNFTILQGRDDRLSWTCDFCNTGSNNRLNRCYTVSSTDGIHWNEVKVFGFNQTAFTGNLYLNGGTDWWLETSKIVGIGRKS